MHFCYSFNKDNQQVNIDYCNFSITPGKSIIYEEHLGGQRKWELRGSPIRNSLSTDKATPIWFY